MPDEFKAEFYDSAMVEVTYEQSAALGEVLSHVPDKLRTLLRSEFDACLALNRNTYAALKKKRGKSQ